MKPIPLADLVRAIASCESVETKARILAMMPEVIRLTKVETPQTKAEILALAIQGRANPRPMRPNASHRKESR